jgi:hypothetical protein
MGPGNFMERLLNRRLKWISLAYRKNHRITRAPLGAAIPRFSTDGIGVPGPKERWKKKERREKKEKPSTYHICE